MPKALLPLIRGATRVGQHHGCFLKLRDKSQKSQSPPTSMLKMNWRIGRSSQMYKRSTVKRIIINIQKITKLWQWEMSIPLRHTARNVPRSGCKRLRTEGIFTQEFLWRHQTKLWIVLDSCIRLKIFLVGWRLFRYHIYYYRCF